VIKVCKIYSTGKVGERGKKRLCLTDNYIIPFWIGYGYEKRSGSQAQRLKKHQE